MATLVVRRLDDEIVRRLKARAAAHGRSAEAEHRAILEHALRPRMTGAEFWAALRGSGPYLDDDDAFFKALEEHDQPAEPPDLPE